MTGRSLRALVAGLACIAALSACSSPSGKPSASIMKVKKATHVVASRRSSSRSSAPRVSCVSRIRCDDVVACPRGFFCQRLAPNRQRWCYTAQQIRSCTLMHREPPAV